MLKLKYLFDNRELATMLVKNWHYDEDSLELFEYFRISSNAIYPFKYQEKLYFLRFVPAAEKDITQIEQELKVISICAQNGLHVANCLESKSGKNIVTQSTPWGVYHAVVFESVGQKTLENVEMTDEIAYAYGQSLAKLHHISKNHIKTKVDRVSVIDILEMISKDPEVASEKYPVLTNQVAKLRADFSALPNNEQTFGIIHYDFELDNILVNQEKDALYAIDFDDCVFGFYGQDVERAINSIESEVDEALQESVQSHFLKGYADGNGDLGDYQKNRALYKAYADLYAYYRMRNSLEDQWENEPEWMLRLRARLSDRMNRYLENLSV